MIRKIKGLGLAFVAIAAMSMVAASAGQAAEVHVTSGGNTSIFGQQTAQQHKFQLTGSNGSTQCKQALFEGTQNGSGQVQTTTDELTVTATYTDDCTSFGLASQIDMNGCKFTLTGGGQPMLTFKMDIRHCTQTDKKAATDPSGSGFTKSIEITVLGGAVITVPEQNSIGGHIVFANEGVHPTGSLTANFTLQGITYECHGNVPGCAATVTTHDGDYVGQATFQGKQDPGSAIATHNGHQYLKLNQTGGVVGLVAT